jgi:hypothetical protein
MDSNRENYLGDNDAYDPESPNYRPRSPNYRPQTPTWTPSYTQQEENQDVQQEENQDPFQGFADVYEDEVYNRVNLVDDGNDNNGEDNRYDDYMENLKDMLTHALNYIRQMDEFPDKEQVITKLEELYNANVSPWTDMYDLDYWGDVLYDYKDSSDDAIFKRHINELEETISEFRIIQQEEDGVIFPPEDEDENGNVPDIMKIEYPQIVLLNPLPEDAKSIPIYTDTVAFDPIMYVEDPIYELMSQYQSDAVFIHYLGKHYLFSRKQLYNDYVDHSLIYYECEQESPSAVDPGNVKKSLYMLSTAVQFYVPLEDIKTLLESSVQHYQVIQDRKMDYVTKRAHVKYDYTGVNWDGEQIDVTSSVHCNIGTDAYLYRLKMLKPEFNMGPAPDQGAVESRLKKVKRGGKSKNIKTIKRKKTSPGAFKFRQTTRKKRNKRKTPKRKTPKRKKNTKRKTSKRKTRKRKTPKRK